VGDERHVAAVARLARAGAAGGVHRRHRRERVDRVRSVLLDPPRPGDVLELALLERVLGVGRHDADVVVHAAADKDLQHVAEVSDQLLVGLGHRPPVRDDEQHVRLCRRVLDELIHDHVGIDGLGMAIVRVVLLSVEPGLAAAGEDDESCDSSGDPHAGSSLWGQGGPRMG